MPTWGTIIPHKVPQSLLLTIVAVVTHILHDHQMPPPRPASIGVNSFGGSVTLVLVVLPHSTTRLFNKNPPDLDDVLN